MGYSTDDLSEVGTEMKRRKSWQNGIISNNEAKCDKLIEDYSKSTGDNTGLCSPIFDGILCWDKTEAGTIAQQPCPIYFMGYQPQENAFKECLTTGSWFTNHKNRTFTNFTLCTAEYHTNISLSWRNEHDELLTQYVPTLSIIAEIGYGISLLSLIVAFTILISIKKLRCPRNVMHMHLFASFILRAVLVILQDWLPKPLDYAVIPLVKIDGNGELVDDFEIFWRCRMLTVIWQYAIMSNYSWILMEGMYLHNLVFLSRFTESSSISLFVILGWGLPAVFVVAWTICKALLHNFYCWSIMNKNIFLIIQIPIVLSLVINAKFFINVVRFLVRNVEPNANEESKAYRRYLKYSLVLAPLFGVQYVLLLCLEFSSNPIAELVWLFGSIFFCSFNGVLAAFLYCFLNREVKSELYKKWCEFSFCELLKGWHLCERNNKTFSSSQLSRDRHHGRHEAYITNSSTIDTAV